jgi:uncharacterized protein (TIGR02246 family)
MTTSLMTTQPPATSPVVLDESEVQRLVQHWLRARDEGRPARDVLQSLAADGLVVHFPQVTLRGRQQFSDWYARTKERFPRERHEVEQIDVRLTSPLHAEVTLGLRWQMWGLHGAEGWIGVDATQQWSVVLREGTAFLRTLATEDVHPLPGSAPLDRIS